MKTKVFIVDDHLMVIEGIRSLLSNEVDIEWEGHAVNGTQCLAHLQKARPDVILMDINLPDSSGIDLCAQVKEKHSSCFVIGLSTFNQQSFISRMMENGASGYVLKNATKEELLEAIQTVMRGRTYLSEEASQALQERPERSVLLTRREKEVLELIAEGMTNAEIAEKLYISVTTVDTHRKNLLAKFDCRNIASLVRMAIKLGLIK